MKHRILSFREQVVPRHNSGSSRLRRWNSGVERDRSHRCARQSVRGVHLGYEDHQSTLYPIFLSDMRKAEPILIQSPDANASTLTEEKCFLGTLHLLVAIKVEYPMWSAVGFVGRPWNDLATTVFLRTFMDDSINSVGFIPFDAARYDTTLTQEPCEFPPDLELTDLSS